MVSHRRIHRRGILHRKKHIVYLLTLLAWVHNQTALGESAVSVKLDAPLVQEVVKSLSSVKAGKKDNDTAETDSDELRENDKAAIKTITSEIKSWMDMKRQRDLSKNQAKLFEDKTQTRHRPFVTLAYAQTLDGMIAGKIERDEGTHTTSNLKLSCPQSLVLTHKLRNMHDAIIVGGSTFLIDAPKLNVRLPSNIIRESLVEQPVPVVLDTHLNSLQKILWGKVIPKTEDEQDNVMPLDMYPEHIRAQNPIMCCSSNAAKLFLDHLELFQQQQKPVKNVDEFPGQLNRQQKRVYKITVYKMVDEENDHEDDLFLPIKITIQVTLEGNKVDEADTVTTTFSLLPCQLHKNKQSLDLQNVLQQLNRQFEVESAMVEGGAGVISSFIGESVGSRKDKKSGDKKIVDCICATVTPSLIGKRGLPLLGEFDRTCHQKDGRGDVLTSPITLGHGLFVSLGRDCAFLGKL